MVADVAVPCGPAAVDVWAMTEPVEIIGEARKIRLISAFALVTRAPRRSRRHRRRGAAQPRFPRA
jgi:hypothetical protein